VLGRIFGVLGAIVGAVVLGAIVLFAVSGHAYRMASAAMEPTLHCARPVSGCRARFSDRVLALGFLGWGRGDVVAFHMPPLAALRCGAGGTYIKRVIGLPGDTIHEDAQGFIWVNGSKLQEPYVDPRSRAGDANHNKTWRVAAGKYFVLGDDRSLSCDSRYWGGVPRKDIVGKISVVYWPPSRIGFR
jgi:signal peptidase I